MVSSTIKYEETFCCHYFELPIPSNNQPNEKEKSNNNNNNNNHDDSIAANPESNPVLAILDELFEGVSAELIHLVEKGDKRDHFYPVLLLYELEKYMASGGPTHHGTTGIVRTTSSHALSDNVSYFFVNKIGTKVENTIRQLFNKFVVSIDSLPSFILSINKSLSSPFFFYLLGWTIRID